MAAAIFGLQGSVNLNAVTAEEKAKLELVLALKLEGISIVLRPNITIDDILRATKPSSFPFNNADGAHPATTLAGTFFYRDEIMSNLLGRTDFEDWSFNSLLNFFCSNVSTHFNFSSHFDTTRARLYTYVGAWDKEQETELQRLYILACAEETSKLPHPRFETRRTVAREAFIRKFMENPAEYSIYKRAAIKSILGNLHKTMDRIKSDDGQNENGKLGGLINLLKTLFKHELDQPQPQPPLPVTQHEDEITTLEINKFKDAFTDNPLLHGLLWKCPGFSPYEVHEFLPDAGLDELHTMKAAVKGITVTPISAPDDRELVPSKAMADRIALDDALDRLAGLVL